MTAPENILLIRLKSIGDIVFTLPAVHAVRENFPDARLHFLVSKEHAELLRGFSDIDEIIPLDRAMYRSGNPIRLCSNFFKLVHHLREKNFSHLMDFQGYGETAWLSWLSGAPERWGCVYQTVRAWAYTRSVPRNQKIHPAEWRLELLRRCGLRVGPIRNEYILPADALAEGEKFFAENHLKIRKPTLFIQPFTSNPKKNWPLERFLDLARHFQSKDVQIVFGGGPNDRSSLESARTMGFAIAAGTPLPVSAALTKLSTVVVGADTGLLHLAVAMGKRVVMLMKSNAPGACHPFQHPDWTVMPSTRKTAFEIQTNAVIEACARAFADCEADAINVKLPQA
jgi:ADP-heptose:LPS heptosyltransferase